MGAIDDRQTSWIIMGVFDGIRITENNTMNKLSLVSFKIGGCKTY